MTASPVCAPEETVELLELTGELSSLLSGKDLQIAELERKLDQLQAICDGKEYKIQ